MDRRKFLQTTSTIPLLAVGTVSISQTNYATAREKSVTSSLRKGVISYTAVEHRRRLENIAICQRGVKTCLKKHLIMNYLPGQAYYNLGEYPAKKPWQPSEYDGVDGIYNDMAQAVFANRRRGDLGMVRNKRFQFTGCSLTKECDRISIC